MTFSWCQIACRRLVTGVLAYSCAQETGIADLAWTILQENKIQHRLRQRQQPTSRLPVPPKLWPHPFCFQCTKKMAAPRCGDVCLTEDEVNQITDLFQAFQWIQKLDINPSGITDVEGAKCRLLHYLKEQYGAGKHQRADVSAVLSDMRSMCFCTSKLRRIPSELSHTQRQAII